MRDLDCERVVKETAPTIHAQELPSTSRKRFSTFKNAAMLINPCLKGSRRQIWIRIRKFRFPFFNVLGYRVLLLFSQHMITSYDFGLEVRMMTSYRFG